MLEDFQALKVPAGRNVYDNDIIMVSFIYKIIQMMIFKEVIYSQVLFPA
jgi:hypothetical protein